MMAADKEQAKKSGEKEEVVKEEKPKTINHNDHYSIKRVLDDAVSEVGLPLLHFQFFRLHLSHLLLYASMFKIRLLRGFYAVRQILECDCAFSDSGGAWTWL